MTMCFRISFIIVTILFYTDAARKEKCEQCVRIEKCPYYGNLNREEQERWVERFECSKRVNDDLGPLFGFAPMAKGDMVCCPSSDWGNNNQQSPFGTTNNFNNNRPDYVNNHNNGWRNNNANNGQGNDNYNNRPGFNSNNRPFDHSNIQQNHPQNGNPGVNPVSQGWRPKPGPVQGVRNPPNQNPHLSGGHQNSFGGSNLGGQCPVTSFPPNPDSGCCGREASDEDRITGSHHAPSNRYPVRNTRPNWMSRYDGRYNQNDRPDERGSPLGGFLNFLPRLKRSPPIEVNVTIDNRIAGGKETDLEQFPWTVLLKTTFDYGFKEASFNCGGSLISSRYVLTAAHCVVEEGAKVKDMEIFIAEYDKRTFPRDCKNVLGEGQKCIENIVQHAENIIPHSGYDDTRLHNDIALIRLHEAVPYTNYIRPICLPTINVDDPDLFNLRLAVAGWGRNGQYKSDIKQSTVVNLIPNRECSRFYPHLSRAQLCAAGYRGEDTCKGDSGGPLMVLYEGKYYVAGVVSGKRADSPCGTSVPSLYTNVYKYLSWIRENMRN